MSLPERRPLSAALKTGEITKEALNFIRGGAATTNSPAPISVSEEITQEKHSNGGASYEAASRPPPAFNDAAAAHFPAPVSASEEAMQKKDSNAEASRKSKLPPPRPKTPATKEQTVPSRESAGVSIRLSGEIRQALLQASFDRRLRLIEPSSQQEIVAEALAAWLKKNNYL